MNAVNELTLNVVAGLLAGKSLREMGRELNIDHRKVGVIGAKAGVYSVRSKKENVVIDIPVADVDSSDLYGLPEVDPVPVQRTRKVYGRNVWHVQRRTGMPWRKAVRY